MGQQVILHQFWLSLAGSDMLLRNKKVTVMAYWEERKLGNLKPGSARVSVKREKHRCVGKGD